MLNITNISAQCGGQTNKLLKGPKPYKGRTLDEMATEVAGRIEETVQALDAWDGEELTAPMAKKVRNGVAVKIGYGAKNEALEGIPVQYF